MMMDLKVIIGTHSADGDPLPRMDSRVVAQALSLLETDDAYLYRQMTNDEWYWWRTCEHIRETAKPTLPIREWMKLDITDEDEPRVVEVCEAARRNVGGKCVRDCEGRYALKLCNGVRPQRKECRGTQALTELFWPVRDCVVLFSR